MQREVVSLNASARLTLARGPHSMEVAPAAGGRITRFSTTLDDGTAHDWLVPITAKNWPADAWPKGGCYPLVPFSNRVRDARFTAPDGTRIELSTFPGAAHALHGFGQYEAWTVESQSADEVVLRYTHEAGREGWPWAFEATQTFALTDDGARLTMRIRNVSEREMPVGFGFHPYFTADAADLDAHVDWRHEAEIAIEPSPDAPRRHHEREAAGYTRYLGGWDRHARLRFANGALLTLSASDELSHVVTHCPAGAAYLCVEPVSHVSDGFNLQSKGLAGTGVSIIAPGSETQAWLELGTGVRRDARDGGAF